MNETVIADEKEETLRNKLRILRDTEDSYGADSIETETEKTEAAELCCTIALSSVYESKPQSPNPESDQMERAKSLLEAALILLRPGTIQPTVKVIQTRASVYSNIAMLYRKTGRLRAALISSQKASNLYRSLSLPDDPTVSESLISSLLSESSLLCSSGKPKDGLIVAKEALLLCSNLEVMARQQQDILSSDQNKRSAASEELPEDFHYANLQAMCHHNVGVCQEFLGKCRQCLNSYRTAFQLAYLSGGPDHPLSVRFKECFASAYADAHKKRTKQHMRAIARIKKYDPQPSAIIAAGERRQRLVPVNAAAAKRYNINNRLPKEADATNEVMGCASSIQQPVRIENRKGTEQSLISQRSESYTNLPSDVLNENKDFEMNSNEKTTLIELSKLSNSDTTDTESWRRVVRKYGNILMAIPPEKCRGEIRQHILSICDRDITAGLFVLPSILRYGVHSYSQLQYLIESGFVSTLINLITHPESTINPKLVTDILRLLYLQAPPCRQHVRMKLFGALATSAGTEPVNHGAIITVLSFLLPIFEGFNTPLKQDHEFMLTDKLSLLYKLNYVTSSASSSVLGHVHEVLSNCVRVLLRKVDADSHVRIIVSLFNTILGEWDPTESDKCTYLLSSFQDLIEEMDSEAFTIINRQIFKHLACCMSSQNSIISLKAHSILSSNTLIGFLHINPSIAVQHLTASIVRGRLHWCKDVNTARLSSISVLKSLNSIPSFEQVAITSLTQHPKTTEEATSDFNNLISELESLRTTQMKAELNFDMLQRERNNSEASRKPFPVTVDNHLHFAFGRAIGKGSYSVVKYARRIEVSVPQSLWKSYAIKIISKSEIEEHYTEQIEQEINVLREFDCKYITPLFATFSDQKNIYVVMEYCETGDLFQAVFEDGHGSVGLEWLVFGASQIIVALEYIHERGYYYGDLKTENILVASDGFLRLCDFGSSKSSKQLSSINEMESSKRDFRNEFSGTLDFLSPEVVRNKEVSQSADWWAFGVVLVQLSCGVLPFSASDDELLIELICTSPPVVDGSVPGDLRLLIDGLLMKGSNSRFSSSNCRQSAVFSSIPWESLHSMKVPPVGFGYRPKKNMADCSYMERKFSIRQCGPASAKTISLPPIPEETASQCSWSSAQPPQDRLWRVQEKTLSVPPLKKPTTPVVNNTVATPSNDLSDFCTTRPQPVMKRHSRPR